MTEETRRELEERARRVREHVLRMAGQGGCFVGASLSCVDLLVHLYGRTLHISPARAADPDRDYLLLSKGHAAPALYGTLAEFGFFPAERLANHLRTSDAIYWHPNRSVPGVEFHSGSLGHLLSVGIGVALDLRLRGGSNRVFVLLGDGELNEGSVWEAFLGAAALKLGNLVAVIDRNRFQANFPTEELVPLEPLQRKLEAFGWSTARVDGHDLGALEDAFPAFWPGCDIPCAVIADTVRGKGIASLEERADRWFVRLAPSELDEMLRELRGPAG
jgi:transketolase